MNRQQIFTEAQKWIALLRFAFLLIRKLWAVMKGSQFSKQIFFPYKRSSLLIKQLSGKRTSVWGHFSMGVRVVAEWQNMSTRAYSGRTFSWGMLAMGTQWAISLVFTNATWHRQKSDTSLGAASYCAWHLPVCVSVYEVPMLYASSHKLQ